jgi:integrase
MNDETPKGKATAHVRTRGLGSVYQSSYTDRKTGELRRSAVWWIQYSFRGRVHRESSGSVHRADAVKLLRRRLEEMGRGRLVGPTVERTSLADLIAMLLNDYRVNGRRSLDRMEDASNHLTSFFRDARAVDITPDRVTAYVAFRQREEAANATINRELAALKRMFRLAEKAEKVDRRPYIAMLAENNIRTGFFEHDQFQAVLHHLPVDLQPVFEVAYVTGWRVRSEILTRQWQHVDFQAGWLRLEPGETKNREGRMFPLTPELREVLERQRARTEALQRATGRIVPWIFHREGEPIRYFRRPWLTACKRAGLPGRLPHDFRRTAVRNLERANVPRSVAMKLVGHKTEAIYRRYAIADESMLREAAAKLSALHAAQREALRKVYFEGPLKSFDQVLTKSAGSDDSSLKLRGPQLIGKLRKEMVGRDGIEPPTPGFSVLCSTN